MLLWWWWWWTFYWSYPGFKKIYDDYELFCSKFKIKYEDCGSFWDYCTDSDSDSDDLEAILSDSDSD